MLPRSAARGERQGTVRTTGAYGGARAASPPPSAARARAVVGRARGRGVGHATRGWGGAHRLQRCYQGGERVAGGHGGRRQAGGQAGGCRRRRRRAYAHRGTGARVQRHAHRGRGSRREAHLGDRLPRCGAQQRARERQRPHASTPRLPAAWHDSDRSPRGAARGNQAAPHVRGASHAKRGELGGVFPETTGYKPGQDGPPGGVSGPAHA